MSELSREIEELQRTLARKQEQLRAAQTNCKHDYEEPIYDPETKMEEYPTEEYDERGSDIWPKTSFREKTISRWSRTCKNCGKKEYTCEKRQTGESKPYFK